MSTRKKTPTDYPSLKRSRSGYTGNITKVADKLAELAETDLSTITVRAIDKLNTSIIQSETGYLNTLETAQEYISKEENPDDLLDEDDAAVELFQSAISDAKYAAATLLSLKSISKTLRDLTNAIKAVRDAFTMRPEADQSRAITPLEGSYSAILHAWNEGDHDDDHPLKSRINDCGSQLTQLICEMAGIKDTTPTSPHNRSTSTFSSFDGPRKHENKLPTIEVPTFNGDVMKWASFWAAFQAAVGERDNLSDTTKLIY